MAVPGADQPAPDPPAAAAAEAAPPEAAAPPYHGTEPWVHNACLAAAVLGPVGLFLPPRRLGLRALLLAGGTVIGTNQLVYDFSGQTIAGRVQARAAGLGSGFELPEPARQRQAAMRAERERRAAAQAAAQAQAQAQAPATEAKPEDWVAERQRKEREVLEAGGSYWDLIVGQINEVWTDLRGKGK